jgi:5-methylthioadenosine/S-adenosylhomocysteine deaminase
MTECDLLVTNGYVVTMDERRTLYPDGAVAVAGGRIVDVGPAAEVVAGVRPRRVIDAGGAPVHPGFLDCHVHLLHTARGAFPDTMPFDESMAFYTRWWDALDQEEDFRGSQLAAVEMARNGVTFFMDAGTSLDPDAAAAAAESVGIRASLADPFLWDRGYGLSPDAEMTRAPVELERSLRDLGGQLWRNRDPDALVRGHVAVYGMGASSLELMTAAKRCADDHGVTFTMHQSFTPADVELQRAEYGAAPLVFLQAHGLVERNCALAHMNVLDDAEYEIVLASGVGVVWCVSSSMVWGAGGTRLGRHAEMHRAGVAVGLGADAANSACRFDPSLQALLAVLTGREKTLDRSALGAEDALEMLTIRAARTVGLEAEIGSLEQGKRADLVVRRTDIPESHPGLDPLQGMVFTAGSSSVGTVVVGGRVVVERGRVSTVDEDEVYARTREASDRIIKRLGMRRPVQAWPEVHDRTR